MQQLKLDLATLKVETFETTVARQRPRKGTVLGHGDTYDDPSHCEPCYPDSYACQSELPTCADYGTCQGVVTCNPTIAGDTCTELCPSEGCTQGAECNEMCATRMQGSDYCDGCQPSVQGDTGC